MGTLTGTGETIKAEEIVSAIENEYEIYLTDKIIEGDFILADTSEEEAQIKSPKKVTSRISFISCKFKGRIKLSNVVFKERVDFSGSHFSKEVLFWPNSPEFLNDVDLSFTYFHNRADFSWVKFQKDVDFRQATFYKDADFGHATFRGKLEFTHVMFLKAEDHKNTPKIGFLDCQFIGSAHFSGSRFMYAIDFGGSEFHESVRLDCTFGEDADFGNVIFRKEVILTNSSFGKNLILASAQIGRIQFGHEFLSKEWQRSLSNIRISQIMNSKQLIIKIRDAKDPLSKYLKNKFSQDTRNLLDQYVDNGQPLRELERKLVYELNEQVRGPVFFNKQVFKHVLLNEETRDLIGLREQGISEDPRLNRLLLDDAYPEEIERETFGINFSKDSHIILSGAIFDQLLIRWNILREHLIDEEATDSSILQQLIEGYKKMGWFYDADKCVRYYADKRLEKLLKDKLYVSWFGSCLKLKWLYGYGIHPEYPLYLGTTIFGIFTLIIFVEKYLEELGKNSQLQFLCVNQTVSVLLDAIWVSLASFVVAPPQSDLMTTIERLIGWIILSCFLVVLAKRTIR